MVASDVVANLEDMEGNHHEEDISVAMVTTGLEGMLAYFLLSRKDWSQGGSMWCMLRQGSEVRSRTNYWRWWE